VTAQRENLQQVPIAATALDAAALGQLARRRLQTATPSLSITNAGERSQHPRIGLASNSPCNRWRRTRGRLVPAADRAVNGFMTSRIEVLHFRRARWWHRSTGGAISLTRATRTR
jgi:hypothetical protein